MSTIRLTVSFCLLVFSITFLSCGGIYAKEEQTIKSRVSDFSMFIGGNTRFSWVDFYPDEIIRQINEQGQSSMVMNKQTQTKYLGSPVASPDDVKVTLRGKWARVSLKIPTPWNDKVGEFWYKHRGKWYVWDRKLNQLGVLNQFQNPPFSDNPITDLMN